MFLSLVILKHNLKSFTKKCMHDTNENMVTIGHLKTNLSVLNRASASSSERPHRNIPHELSCSWKRYRLYCMLHQHLGRAPLWQLKYYFGRIKFLQVQENATKSKHAYSWSSLFLPRQAGCPCAQGQVVRLPPPTSAPLLVESLPSLCRCPDSFSLL